MTIMNAGEYLHYTLDGIESRCRFADRYIIDPDYAGPVEQEGVEGMALNRMSRLDLDDGTDPYRRARADQARDLWSMNRSHQRRVQQSNRIRERPAVRVVEAEYARDAAAWPPADRAVPCTEAEEFARFLLVRREPEYLIDQYAGTCAIVAGHLETVAAMLSALHLDDAFVGRWAANLPARCARMALERAAVWHSLAAVPDRVRGTYVDILTGVGS